MKEALYVLYMWILLQVVGGVLGFSQHERTAEKVENIYLLAEMTPRNRILASCNCEQ